MMTTEEARDYLGRCEYNGDLINYLSAAVGVGEIPDRFDDIAYFLSKPWKWSGEFAEWVNQGRPDASDYEPVSA